MARCFFLLQRWRLSPDRGIRIVILLRFCWIGVYCFDLCNNTFFFFLNDCMFHFFRGFAVMRAKELVVVGGGCWRKDLEWWWCGFWPSRPGICTLVTEDILWLYRLTLQRLKGKPELHVAGNEGVFQVQPSAILRTMISSIMAISGTPCQPGLFFSILHLLPTKNLTGLIHMLGHYFIR